VIDVCLGDFPLSSGDIVGDTISLFCADICEKLLFSNICILGVKFEILMLAALSLTLVSLNSPAAAFYCDLI